MALALLALTRSLWLFLETVVWILHLFDVASWPQRQLLPDVSALVLSCIISYIESLIEFFHCFS